jgi:hypothetical protein
MKSVFFWDVSVTQPKITTNVYNNNNKNNHIFRKNGISYTLMKIYIIVPDNLKSLIKHKNYFYIYYPIKDSDFLQNKNFHVNSEYNKYKICLTKKDIIEEVKYFLGIKESNTMYDFDLYNQNLGILKSSYKLSKSDNIDNNIIYIKVKLNKENSKIRQTEDIPCIPKLIKYKTKKSKLMEYLMQNPKNKNYDPKLKAIINNTIMTFGSNKKFITKRNYPNHRRKISVKKYDRNSNLLTSYNTNKIDKNTNTDDLAYEEKNLRNKKIFDNPVIENYKNSLINFKNSHYYIRNINNKPYYNKRNLSSLDYYPMKDGKSELSQLLLFNKFKMIRNIKKRDTFYNYNYKNNYIDDISINNTAALSYQDRYKFVKSIFKVNHPSAKRIKQQNIHLSQPNIIKSYIEAYSNNLNSNNINNHFNN